MEDKNTNEPNHYLGARIYGSVMEYFGIIAGISAGVSGFQNGFGLREAGVIFSGAFLYTGGKILNSFADRSNQMNEFSRRDLEEKLQNPEHLEQ